MQDLYGLEAISKHCTKLQELNLSNLHIHSTNKDLNRLCSIISSINKLRSLSLPACCLVNNIACNHPDSSRRDISPPPQSPLWRAESFKTKVSSNLLYSLDSSNPKFSSSSSSTLANLEAGSSSAVSHHPTTRLSRLISNTETMVNAIGSGFEPIVKGCNKIEQLEIVDTGFHSAFSRVVIDQFIWYVFYVPSINFVSLHVKNHIIQNQSS